MGETEHQRQLQIRLKEQINFMEVSSARYDAGWPEEANRLALVVRVLIHDTKNSKSLFKQLGVKEKLQWIDTNGLRDARKAIMFSSMVVFRIEQTEEGPRISIMPNTQQEILDRGKFLDFKTWWEVAPVMVGAGEIITRSDIVDMLANQDGGAHVDIKKQKFSKLLSSIPQIQPFIDDQGQGASFGIPSAPGPELAREILRAAMRTIAEEVWLGWNNQLDLITPGWQEKKSRGGRIGPDDLISGRR